MCLIAPSTVESSRTATKSGDIEPAGGVLGILEDLLDVLGLLFLHELEDLLGLVPGQLVDDVGRVLRRHLVEDARDLDLVEGAHERQQAGRRPAPGAPRRPARLRAAGRAPPAARGAGAGGSRRCPTDEPLRTPDRRERPCRPRSGVARSRAGAPDPDRSWPQSTPAFQIRLQQNAYERLRGRSSGVRLDKCGVRCRGRRALGMLSAPLRRSRYEAGRPAATERCARPEPRGPDGLCRWRSAQADQSTSRAPAT